MGYTVLHCNKFIILFTQIIYTTIEYTKAQPLVEDVRTHGNVHHIREPTDVTGYANACLQYEKIGQVLKAHSFPPNKPKIANQPAQLQNKS